MIYGLHYKGTIHSSLPHALIKHVQLKIQDCDYLFRLFLKKPISLEIRFELQLGFNLLIMPN